MVPAPSTPTMEAGPLTEVRPRMVVVQEPLLGPRAPRHQPTTDSAMAPRLRHTAAGVTPGAARRLLMVSRLLPLVPVVATAGDTRLVLAPVMPTTHRHLALVLVPPHLLPSMPRLLVLTRRLHLLLSALPRQVPGRADGVQRQLLRLLWVRRRLLLAGTMARLRRARMEPLKLRRLVGLSMRMTIRWMASQNRVGHGRSRKGDWCTKASEGGFSRYLRLRRLVFRDNSTL